MIDALFPIRCLSCQKEGFWLCEECRKEIKLLDFQVCPVCEKIITEKGKLCISCQKEGASDITAMVSAVPYDNPTVKKLAHAYKYRFLPDISEPLTYLLSKSILQNDFPIPDFICPVPLHPKRLRWRGFNQSLLLSEKISENLVPFMKIEVLDILERTKYNPPQMSLKNYQERLQNVKNIFAIKKDSGQTKIKNKTILIIDDIATTGATLEECAKVLKSAGAKKVFAAVIARQSWKR
ncbi:MAG: ComF family protein [Candidatus Moranbacteria bacterium]|nr:ComF family protein [Candidatus Moranbacteria bacterium]